MRIDRHDGPTSDTFNFCIFQFFTSVIWPISLGMISLLCFLIGRKRHYEPVIFPLPPPLLPFPGLEQPSQVWFRCFRVHLSKTWRNGSHCTWRPGSFNLFSKYSLLVTISAWNTSSFAPMTTGYNSAFTLIFFLTKILLVKMYPGVNSVFTLSP